MILGASDPTWADTWQAYGAIASAAISAVSTILSASFLWYTIRTFREIKRQTDLQVEAFLVVFGNIIPRPNEPLDLKPDVRILHAKWRGILEKNLPAAVQADDRYLSLKLKNRGRSDVVDWKVTLTIVIEPGPILSKDNIIGERHKWHVESIGSQHIIPPEGEIDVVVAQVGAFPEATITWLLEYTDSRKTRFTYFAGDAQKKEVNAFASTVSSTAAG